MARGHECRSANTLGRSRRRRSKRFGKLQQLFVSLSLFLLTTSITRVSAQHDETTGLRASQAAQTLQSVPRFGRPDMLPNVFDGLTDEGGNGLNAEDFKDYAWGIGFSAAAGIVFSVLTFVICCGFCVGRSCCDSCGGREPKPEGYTKRHKIIVFTVMVVATAIVVIFCGVGYQGNDQFSKSLRGDEGLTLLVGAFFDDLGAFFSDRLQDGPVEAVNSFIDTSLDGLERALEDVAMVQASRDNLTTNLQTLSDTFNDFSITGTDDVTGQSFTFDCDYCADVAETVDGVQGEITAQSGDTLDEILQLEEQANETIQDLGTDVQEQIQEVLSSFDDIVQEQEAVSGDIDDALDVVEGYDKQRNLAYVILFALPLPIIFMILIGAIVKSPLCFQLTCILSFVIMVLFWLLFALHLPLGVLLSDACLLLDEQEQNITRMFGDDIGPVMLACLQRTPLTEVYNLTSALPNADTINFSDDLAGLNTSFNFTELSDLIDESISLSNDQFFGVLTTCLDDLEVFTTASFVTPPEMYDRSNLTDLDATELYPSIAIENGTVVEGTLDENSFDENDPGVKYCNQDSIRTENGVQVTIPFDPIICGQFLVQLLACQAIQRAETATQPDFEVAIADFQEQTDRVNASASELTMNIDVAIDNLLNVENELETELFAQIDQLVTDLNCEFAGDLYRNVKTGLCEEVLSGILKMVQALFFIPIFSIAISITAILCWKRVDADGDGTRFNNHAGAKVSNYDDEFDDYGPAKVETGYSEAGGSGGLQMSDYGNVSRTHSAAHPVNNLTQLRYSVNEEVPTNPRGESLAGASERSLSSRDYDDDSYTDSVTRDEGLPNGTAPPEFDDSPQNAM